MAFDGALSEAKGLLRLEKEAMSRGPPRHSDSISLFCKQCISEFLISNPSLDMGVGMECVRVL